MARWVRAAAVADCPPGGACEVVVEGQVLAVYNVEGDVFALDGVCPHQGGPLGEGKLVGRVVTCPWHGWQFDVTCGQHQFSANVKQPAFAAKIDGDAIFVDLGD